MNFQTGSHFQILKYFIYMYLYFKQLSRDIKDATFDLIDNRIKHLIISYKHL